MGQTPVSSAGCLRPAAGCPGANQPPSCCEPAIIKEVETVAACTQVPVETVAVEGSMGEPSEVFGPLAAASLSRRSRSTPDDSLRQRVSAVLEVDQSVLRGIHVRRLLRPDMWRRRAHMEEKEGEQMYALSQPVEALGAFLSHNWDADIFLKVVALTLQTSWPFLLACWVANVSLFFLLCVAEILPLPFVNGSREDADPFGCWILAASPVGIALATWLAPCVPGGTCVFMDMACVHQTCADLKRKAIYSIGGFLQVSQELWVLWSPQYLSRLWCVFEIAAFRIGNPNGQLRILPLFMSKSIVILYLGSYLSTWAVWCAMALGVNNNLMVAPSLIPLTAMVHSLRRNCRTKDKLLDELRAFQLASLKCSTLSDRAYILPAIERWYGSLEGFEIFVRTTLYEDLKPMQGSPRTGHQLLIMTSFLALSAEHTLSVIRAGYGWHGVLARLLAVHLGVHVFVILFCLRFIFVLSARYAAPLRSAVLDVCFSGLLVMSVAVLYSGSFFMAFAMVEAGLLPSAIFSFLGFLVLLLARACLQR